MATSANLKRAVKRIKATLNANYEQAQVTPTAGPVGTGKAFIGGQVFDANISGVTQVVNVGRPAAAQYAAKVGGVTVTSSGGGGSTSSGGGTGAAITSSFVIADPEALLPNARLLAVSAALSLTDAGAGGAITVGMATPPTLSATSTNDATTGSHAITASAAPGAAESLLKSTSAGLLTLPQFTATTNVTTPSLLSPGDLTITPTGGDIFANARLDVITGTSGATTSSSYSGIAVHAASNAGLQLLTPNTGVGLITFGDPDDNDVGRILYRHSSDRLDFETGGTLRATLGSTYTWDVTGTMRATTSLTTPLLTTATNVDLVINPAGTGAVQFPNDQKIRTSTFDGWAIPYTTGFQINEFEPVPGGSSSVLTIGRIQADELDVRVFVANETRVSRGDEFWTKSFGILAESFTTPSSIGGTVSVKFEDSPAIVGAIFVNSDWVLIRKLEIDTGASLYNVWGQVATYVNNGDGTQSWTFTLRGGPTDKLIDRGSLGIDFGQVGAGLIHLSVVDASGSPYIKLRKWVSGSDPMTIDGPNFNTYVQIGNLDSVSNSYYTPSGYGLYIRSTAAEDQFMVADDNGLQIRGPSISLYNSTTQTILMNNTSGINVRDDVWGSWDNRRALQWWPDVSSMSSDPSLSVYTGKVVGGLTANQNFSYIDANPTGNVLAGLSITAFGQGTAADATLYLEGGSQSLTTTPSITMTATDINLVGDTAITGTVSATSASVTGTASARNVYLDADTGTTSAIVRWTTSTGSNTYWQMIGQAHDHATSAQQNDLLLQWYNGSAYTTLLYLDYSSLDVGTRSLKPLVTDTYDLGTSSLYYNNLYARSLHVDTIVGTPSYSHTHSASEITSGTLDFARMATTWNGALTLDADTGLTSNYVRWTTQTSTLKAWDLIGRAHDYATSAQQNDLLLTYTDNVTSYIVWQADSGTRVVDFLNTPTVGGTAVSLSTHTHAYVPTSRTVTAGSGLTGGGALSADITISHDDTSTQASVNNSGTTFIQDVTLDGFGHVTALGSVDISTALEALYVNVSGDTMTGTLTINAATQLALQSSGTDRASLVSGNNTLDINPLPDGSADMSVRLFRLTNTSGSKNLTLLAGDNTATIVHQLSVTGTTIFNAQLSNIDFNIRGDTDTNLVYVDASADAVGFGTSTPAYKVDATGSIRATVSVLTPTVTTTSDNLSLTSAGGTVAVTGALTGSSTGVFTSTLTAASDSDSTHIFGRAKIGSAIASDSATFAHFDYNTPTGFALAQYFGATYLNAASGQSVRLANAGNSIAAVGASGIDMQAGMYIGSSDYASQQTGWRVDQSGGADFRYLYADQLHVKSFIADLEQALAGGQIISKSVAILAADFVTPYAGGTQLLTVEDLPSAANMAVFETNDIVAMRSFSRASGSLSVTYCYGTVTGYTDGAGVQTWTFTRSGTTTYNAVTMRGTAQSSTSSGATSRSVTKPTGVISGDVLIAVVTHDGSPDVITATGWTSLGYVSSTDINAEVFYKVAGGSEGASYTFSTVSSHAIGASVVAYYNVNTTSPIDDVTITDNVVGANMTAANTWATSTSGKLVFVGGVSNNTAVTPAAGMTEQIDTGSTGIRVYVADETLTTSGNQNRTATIASSSYASVAASVILRPTYSAMSGSAGAVVPGAIIEADTLVLDLGVAGNGYYEVTAVDGTYGSSSPYAQVVTYATHPAVDSVPRVRMGNLTAISGATAGEYGLYAGSGTIGTTAQYIRVSTAGVQLNNVPLKLYNAGTQTVNIDNAGADIWVGPSSADKRLAFNGTTFALNKVDLTLYNGATQTVNIDSAGTNIWVGPSGADKRLSWNGTTLTVVGAITVSSGSSGYSNFSDKPTTLNSINSSEYTKINSGLDSSGNLITKVLPGSTVGTPGGSGLFLGSDKMGYYNGSRWLTYMDNSGNFTFSSATSAKLAWDGTDLYGTDGTNVQWYARASTGKFYAGNGAVILDRTGILIANDATSAGITLHRTHAFSSSTKAGRMWALSDLSPLRVYLSAGRSVGVDGDASSAAGILDLVGYNSSGTVTAELSVNGNNGTIGVIGDLDMNSNDISEVGSLSVTPAVGTTAIYVGTPTNQTSAGLNIDSANTGTSFGPYINLGRNSNGSTPAAGFLYMANRGGTSYAVWVDNTGVARIGTTLPTNAQDTSGGAIGAQTSSLDTKNIIEPFTDYASALNAIIDAPLFDFTYKSGAYNSQRFTGIVTDYAPTFGMDRDEAHPAGKALNTISAHGYTFAAIKALHNRIEQLENKVKELQHA